MQFQSCIICIDIKGPLQFPLAQSVTLFLETPLKLSKYISKMVTILCAYQCAKVKGLLMLFIIDFSSNTMLHGRKAQGCALIKFLVCIVLFTLHCFFGCLITHCLQPLCFLIVSVWESPLNVSSGIRKPAGECPLVLLHMVSLAAVCKNNMYLDFWSSTCHLSAFMLALIYAKIF